MKRNTKIIVLTIWALTSLWLGAFGMHSGPYVVLKGGYAQNYGRRSDSVRDHDSGLHTLVADIADDARVCKGASRIGIAVGYFKRFEGTPYGIAFEPTWYHGAFTDTQRRFDSDLSVTREAQWCQRHAIELPVHLGMVLDAFYVYGIVGLSVGHFQYTVWENTTLMTHKNSVLTGLTLGAGFNYAIEHTSWRIGFECKHTQYPRKMHRHPDAEVPEIIFQHTHRLSTLTAEFKVLYMF